MVSISALLLPLLPSSHPSRRSRFPLVPPFPQEQLEQERQEAERAKRHEQGIFTDDENEAEAAEEKNASSEPELQPGVMPSLPPIDAAESEEESEEEEETVDSAGGDEAGGAAAEVEVLQTAEDAEGSEVEETPPAEVSSEPVVVEVKPVPKSTQSALGKPPAKPSKPPAVPSTTPRRVQPQPAAEVEQEEVEEKTGEKELPPVPSPQEQTAFGQWDFFREAEKVYRAETDGFVLAQVHGSGHLVLKGFCGEEEELDISIVAFENTGEQIKFSGFMPVPKGNYWKITCAEGDDPEMVGVCWLPIQ